MKAPRTYMPPKGPREYLAYMNPREMEALRRMTDGTMRRGPKGIPTFYMEGDDKEYGSTGGVNSTSAGTGSSLDGTANSNPTGGLGSNYSGDSAYSGSGMSSGTSGGTAGSTVGGNGMSTGGLASGAGPNSTANFGNLGGTISGGLRGLTGPMGQPMSQPSNYGNAYQTSQMMRAAYPNVASRVGQTELARSLFDFGRAMPGEAGTPKHGAAAMNNIGRVGLNQIVGGYSPHDMLANMDTTGMRPATAGFDQPGPHSMGMVGAESPQHTQAMGSLQEALMGQGVSPQAMNASNFAAEKNALKAFAGMGSGVDPVGAPVMGTQFGNDPTWGNRIANYNQMAMAGQPSGVAQSTTAPPQERGYLASAWDALKAGGNYMNANYVEPAQKQAAAVGGWNNAGKLAQIATGNWGDLMGFSNTDFHTPGGHSGGIGGDNYQPPTIQPPPKPTKVTDAGVGATEPGGVTKKKRKHRFIFPDLLTTPYVNMYPTA